MKIYQRLKNKIRVWAVSWVFRVSFRTFMYPFEKADVQYMKMNDYEKANYLREIYNWVNSSAYRLESQELLRKIYQDLALKPCDDISLTAYRLVIMTIQDNQKRLAKISEQYKDMEGIQ
jgi:hypothetical protein